MARNYMFLMTILFLAELENALILVLNELTDTKATCSKNIFTTFTHSHENETDSYQHRKEGTCWATCPR